MRNFIVVCFILFFSGCVIAEDEQIAKIFTKYGVNGTIIISSLDNKHVFIHNDVRANTKFSPASTFKIPNTLIALEEDVILGKDDSIKWDGTLYSYPDWNHDQTLASAFKVSCVWCFQKLAKRVGVDKYHQYLAAINYGELQNPFEVTTFWLDNSLKISPTEQIDFLRKLYQRTLPFNAHSYDTLREIMQVEATSNFKLFAKTGAGGKYNPHMGWYVGYVETEKDVWLFATNLEIRDEKDLPLRHKITKDALITKGIIE